MGFCTFPKSISLKVNVTARLEFELTHIKPAVQHFSHYILETPPLKKSSFGQSSSKQCFQIVQILILLSVITSETEGKRLIFNSKSTFLGLFYALRLKNCIYCMFIVTIFVYWFLKSLFCTQLYSFKYSYLISFKQIYLGYRGNPNWYKHARSERILQ